MKNTFIQRPILSFVISLFIVLLGVFAMLQLPVTQFPDIVPPSVVVTAKYTGANADVSAKAVAMPIERAINGVHGMTYMSTVTSNDGITMITIYFKVGTDPDLAAVNVQNRVTTVMDELPEEVIKAGITTEKEVNSMLMYLNITSKDTTLDEQFIFNFADINILQELKRIDGVGRAEIMGQQEYAMRVWLKPEKLITYNISTDEIIQILRTQNVEAAPGKTGESSGKSKQELQYVIRYTGKFNKPEQYEDIILRADINGANLRLKDVADISFGSMSYGMTSKTDGRPSASIMIKQRPRSNANEVIKNIKDKMAVLKESSFPEGMEYNLAYDVSRFLDASIHEVLKTLIEAFLLVALVVFLFLQDFKSTIIPAIAVPVSLIGTFAFMLMMGFSINLLTLFALVLAIGIVVDDAIVVTEAVHQKMTENNIDAKEATMLAMQEITGALISITLVMSAVFIPAAFLTGPVGVFYRQFSLTMAVAIIISGINALTLIPALCAMFLKRHESNTQQKRKPWLTQFFDSFNRVFDKLTLSYRSRVSKLALRRTLMLSILAISFFLAWGGSKMLPSGFIPTEDQGMIYINVTTPPGSTMERTEKVLDQISIITKDISEIENITTLAGYSLVNEIAGASYGMGMINLKPWNERNKNANEVIALINSKIKNINDAQIEIFTPPTVPGFGNTSGFELRLLDKTGTSDVNRLAEVTKKFVSDLNDSKEITSAFTSFDASFPQYIIHVDQDMAAKKGVSVENAMNTLQTLLGSYYATNFIRFNQMYKVMVQASPEYRTTPSDILKLYVKNNRNEMVPYSTFIRLERVFGTEQLTRYNMYFSSMINGTPEDGYSSGDAIKTVEKIAKSSLPHGFTYEWSGITKEEIISGNQTTIILIISLIFVYLILSAQYESFLLSIPIILSLPAGMFGAFAALKLGGLDNNIYAQVALVMLIGLLGKNAILIVEFAVQRRKEGLSLLNAAIEGATLRLRPILMTSVAFIAGLIPLCMASGAGAIGNRSIGMAAAGGMLVGTFFGVILVPGLYVIFATLDEKIRKK